MLPGPVPIMLDGTLDSMSPMSRRKVILFVFKRVVCILRINIADRADGRDGKFPARVRVGSEDGHRRSELWRGSPSMRQFSRSDDRGRNF